MIKDFDCNSSYNFKLIIIGIWIRPWKKKKKEIVQLVNLVLACLLGISDQFFTVTALLLLLFTY